MIIQGITGQMGRFSARARRYGTAVVAGVSPGRGGSRWTTFRSSAARGGARARVDAALVYVPPAVSERARSDRARPNLVVATADEVPVRDSIEIRAAAKAKGAEFVGPNCPGMISPGKAKLGFMPTFCYHPAR